MVTVVEQEQAAGMGIGLFSDGGPPIGFRRRSRRIDIHTDPLVPADCIVGRAEGDLWRQSDIYLDWAKEERFIIARWLRPNERASKPGLHTRRR